MALKRIIFDSEEDGEMVIDTPTIKAKSFTGVERKLKGKEIVAILNINPNQFIAFVEETD